MYILKQSSVDVCGSWTAGASRQYFGRKTLSCFSEELLHEYDISYLAILRKFLSILLLEENQVKTADFSLNKEDKVTMMVA